MLLTGGTAGRTSLVRSDILLQLSKYYWEEGGKWTFPFEKFPFTPFVRAAVKRTKDEIQIPTSLTWFTSQTQLVPHVKAIKQYWGGATVMLVYFWQVGKGGALLWVEFACSPPKTPGLGSCIPPTLSSGEALIENAGKDRLLYIYILSK